MIAPFSLFHVLGNEAVPLTPVAACELRGPAQQTATPLGDVPKALILIIMIANVTVTKSSRS